MKDFFGLPDMPVGLPLLMAFSVLVWIIFLIHFSYQVRTKGWLAGINQTAGFLIALALGSTVITSAVWNWAPRQVASRVSTSAGWQLIQDASGGTLRLGDQAAAIAQEQGVTAGSSQYVVNGPVVVTAVPSGGVLTQPVVSGFNYEPLDSVPVVIVAAQLQLKHWDATGWDMPGVGDRKGTACGKWLDPAGQKWLVACPASGGVIFPADQVDWRGAGISFPEPTPASAPIPTKTPEELNKLIGACWAEFATAVNLRYVTDKIGAAVLPYGTHWTLTGPGGFLDFGSWTGAKDEVWYLNSDELGIQNYAINGDLARSFPGNDDSATVSYIGTGGMCTVR